MPAQLLSTLNEPIPKHPKRPDTSYRVKRNRYPELHRVSVGQMKEEPQMHNIRSRNYSRPELAAMPAGLGSHSQ